MVNQTFYSILFAIILLVTYEPREINFLWWMAACLLFLSALKLQSRYFKNYHLTQIEILAFIFFTATSFSSFPLTVAIATGLYLTALYISHGDFCEIKTIMPVLLSFVIVSMLIELDSKLLLGIIPFCFVALPFILLKIWGCTPLAHPDLEALCKRAGFKHGGIYLWNTIPNQFTAGVIGIFPKTRYLLLSPNLVKEMPPATLEAIVAHEICHSQKFHLILLPLILMAGLVPLFYFESEIIPSALFFALYFRLIFGFYSRLFERQADLHVIALNIPVEKMIEALNLVALNTGTLHKPCWHHHSLFDRIEFLKGVLRNPELAQKFNIKVTLYIFAFFILVFVILIFLR